jgi:hypothetical protein
LAATRRDRVQGAIAERQVVLLTLAEFQPGSTESNESHSIPAHVAAVRAKKKGRLRILLVSKTDNPFDAATALPELPAIKLSR